MKELLQQHQLFDFVRLHNPVQLDNSEWKRVMRARTAYYTCLTRLVNVELEESEDAFYQFMEPITGIDYKPFASTCSSCMES